MAVAAEGEMQKELLSDQVQVWEARQELQLEQQTGQPVAAR